MAPSKLPMHAIKEISQDRLDIRTFCGRDGYRWDVISVRYTARNGNEFRAQIATEGVECRTCLHAMKAEEKKP